MHLGQPEGVREGLVVSGRLGLGKDYGDGWSGVCGGVRGAVLDRDDSSEIGGREVHAQGIAHLAGFGPQQPGAFIDWSFSPSPVLESMLETPRKALVRKQAEQDQNYQLCIQAQKSPPRRGSRQARGRTQRFFSSQVLA